MHKGIFVVGGLVVVAVVGSFWYLSSEKAMEEKAMKEEQSMMAEKAAMQEKAMMAEKAAMQEKDMAEKAMMEKEVMMKNETAKPADSMVKDETMMEKEENAMMVKGGQYVPYDASKIAFAKDGKVVLFFRASWCPTCRSLDADIKSKLSQIPQNVLILDVDYDKYADLKKQYGVTYQHTLVQVDASGNMITKWSGSEGLSELVKQVK